MTNLTLDTSFPGGNAMVDSIDGDTVRLHPDLRDTEGNWFYWSFRVDGAAGREITFQFTAQEPVGMRGPAVSLDEGLSWRWLGNPTGSKDSFRYAFPADAAPVWFSFGMNYMDADWQRFLRRIEGDSGVRQDILCQSRKGRPVPRLRAGPAVAPRHRVLLTARHHCCEMMASYALEGFVAAALADDETGRWYRANVEIAAIPFIDRDGVEDGDQGKNRRPHDHNRDYAGASIHPEIRALREFAPAWSQDSRLVTIDLHCPGIRGIDAERLYQVGAAKPDIWAEQQRLAEILQRVARGPLPYLAANNLPFGERWNVARNYAQGISCSAWFATLSCIRLATSFEIPYANCAGAEVNAASSRAFGRDLAGAVRQYLMA